MSGTLPGTAAVTAYGERQLLALLPNGSPEACERIVAQVNEALTESGVTAQPVFRFTAVGEPDP